MESAYLVVLSTCPDHESGTRIANTLVQEALAACVNILPGLTSVFQWQGKLESSAEVLLIIKTRRSLYRPLEKRIQELHPYELPEIIAVPIEKGLEAYLNWIDSLTGTQ